jgi:hypothetical protein
VLSPVSGDQFSIDPSACNDDIRSNVADKLVGGFCDEKMVHLHSVSSAQTPSQMGTWTTLIAGLVTIGPP